MNMAMLLVVCIDLPFPISHPSYILSRNTIYMRESSTLPLSVHRNQASYHRGPLRNVNSFYEAREDDKGLYMGFE